MRIWGLEDTSDEAEGWKYYGEGMPNIRVDMIKVRASDSVIAAATHGRGIFKGKYIQAERHETPLAVETINATRIYPNPAVDRLHIDSDQNIISVRLIDLLGKEVLIRNSMVSKWSSKA